jgi:hypothetical protein
VAYPSAAVVAAYLSVVVVAYPSAVAAAMAYPSAVVVVAAVAVVAAPLQVCSLAPVSS